MKLSEDQFSRQKDFSLTMCILENLRKQGILSDSDYEAAQRIMTEKYKPIIQPNC